MCAGRLGVTGLSEVLDQHVGLAEQLTGIMLDPVAPEMVRISALGT